MFDCHVHSDFSGDSNIPADTACSVAIDLGLSGIAFTDHLDYDYPNYDNFFNMDFDLYSSFMDNLKERYSGRLKVIKGIEVGIQPHVIEDTLKIVKGYSFDFVICSVHIIDHMDPYQKDYYMGKTKEQAYRRYLEAIYETISVYTDYDIVGHIGYVRRYGDYSDTSMPCSEYRDVIDNILKVVIASGKGIEVNTSGYRCGLKAPMPDYDIIKRYRELGGEIICLGSDAHFKEHIAHSFNESLDLVKAAGFKYLTHFENRKPVFRKIE